MMVSLLLLLLDLRSRGTCTSGASRFRMRLNTRLYTARRHAAAGLPLACWRASRSQSPWPCARAVACPLCFASGEAGRRKLVEPSATKRRFRQPTNLLQAS